LPNFPALEEAPSTATERGSKRYFISCIISPEKLLNNLSYHPFYLPLTVFTTIHGYLIRLISV
jgi:hypothetical protein